MYDSVALCSVQHQVYSNGVALFSVQQQVYGNGVYSSGQQVESVVDLSARLGTGQDPQLVLTQIQILLLFTQLLTLSAFVFFAFVVEIHMFPAFRLFSLQQS